MEMQTTGEMGDAVAAPPPRVYRLRITEVTSILVMTLRSTKTRVGTLEELEKFYRGVLLHNLLLGWWGFPFGLIWTPISLSNNAKALASLRQLAQTGNPGPGWYPDPTGRSQVRFWDGNVWTDQVSAVTTDPLPSNTPSPDARTGGSPSA
jgi:hypothetical protein